MNEQAPMSFEPPSTRRMWADMFGLGEFFRVLSDPSLIVQVHAMMGAVIEHAAASRRIEQKLDRLLEERERDAAIAAIPVANGTDGIGRLTVTGGVADDGNCDVARHGRRVAARD